MRENLFGKYIRTGDPEKRKRAEAWLTGIGLQEVDGLEVSLFLIDLAKKNIEGEISFDEAERLLRVHYEEKPRRDRRRKKEADLVSSRIADLLLDSSFDFSTDEYISIHRRLFEGIYPHAGCFREYSISKREWILRGASVVYGNASILDASVEYDLSVERPTRYGGLSMEETIHHLAVFISRLWQIHPFAEGNTRTTAVFLMKYLRFLGFEPVKNTFAGNSWYFRNALVRANYNNLPGRIYATTEYLEMFLENMLLGEEHELLSINMRIDESVGYSKA
ncbi:MAG: Fic family protein [Bacillota bacterium]|nr:Fic family protein [Bacillota bacterium]